MSNYSKQFYDNWVDVLLRQSDNRLGNLPAEGDPATSRESNYQRYSHLRPRGILLTSSRGVSLHAMDADNDPIIAFGHMDSKSFMTVSHPLFLVRKNGSFQIRREDPGTHNAYVFDEPFMFLRRLSHGRKKFITPIEPYKRMPYTGTWQVMPNGYNRHPPPLEFMHLYLARWLIVDQSSYTAKTTEGVWLRLSNDLGPSRIIIDQELTHERYGEERFEAGLARWERYSVRAYRRTANKIKERGGTVHTYLHLFGNSRLEGVNEAAMTQFVQNVDIYPTRPITTTEAAT